MECDVWNMTYDVVYSIVYVEVMHGVERRMTGNGVGNMTIMTNI